MAKKKTKVNVEAKVSLHTDMTISMERMPGLSREEIRDEIIAEFIANIINKSLLSIEIYDEEDVIEELIN